MSDSQFVLQKGGKGGNKSGKGNADKAGGGGGNKSGGGGGGKKGLSIQIIRFMNKLLICKVIRSIRLLQWFLFFVISGGKK